MKHINKTKAIVLYLLCFISTLSVYGQGRRISGQVTDAENNSEIPGVNVRVKGTSTGAITDLDGNYSLQVPEGSNTLVFSFVGYVTEEVEIGNRSVVDLSLSPDIASLQEVVVVGYGTQKKADLTGAVSVVDVESLTKQPSPQVTEQLQGRVSGVTVLSSGQPGEAPQVRIRGINTFGNNNPLYVVDGIPVGDINSINPNDIENMQVLKDAGSASIYGARAANGVIIITTKKGRGDLKVNYDAYYGTQRIPQDNPYNILSPQEMANLRAKAWQNTYGNDPENPFNDSQYGNDINNPTLPYYILPAGAAQGEVDESSYFLNPNYTSDAERGTFNQIIRANHEGTDWFDEILNPAPIQSHNLSLSQGGENGNFLFSLNYFDQQGTLINTFLKRYTARINSSFNVSDHVRIGENIAFSLSDNSRINLEDAGESPLGMAFREQPIIPVYDIAGNFAGTAAPGLGNARNPVAQLYRNKDNLSRTNRIFGNIFAEVDFLEAFTVRSTFGGNFFTTNASTFDYPEYENVENNTFNQLTADAFNGFNWTWSNTIQYQQNFNDVHDITLLGGTEAYYNQYEEVSGVTQGYFSFDPAYVNLSTGAGTQTNRSLYTEDALFSIFGRLDYTYNDKYLIGATVRRDATSRFTNPRHGVFPSVSAGWRISEEGFMQGVNWLQDLKIRGGYGVMGNQMNVDPANAFTTYSSSRLNSYYDINGNNTIVEGFSRNRIGNPNASWEKNINANFGIDASLFQGRLQLTADYYRKDVVDLLYNPELPASAGIATYPYVNIAEMTNSGFDLSASTYVDITSELKFDATVTFTSYNNEIVNIAEGVQNFDLEGRRFNGSAIVRNAVGHSLGQFFGYQVEGFWDTQEEINEANAMAVEASDNPEAVYQTDIGLGRFRYADIDGDGIITADDRTFLGNPNPDFSYGLNLGLTYRNLDFNMFLYGVYGNEIWNQVKWWTDFNSSFSGAKSHTALYDSWTPGADNSNVSAPIQENAGTFSTANVPNSYFVEDGSYLRARNVQLGYTLPTATLERVGIDRLRIYIQATNLFTITNYSGVDPELTGGEQFFGLDEGSYPTPRNYLVGVNLSF